MDIITLPHIITILINTTLTAIITAWVDSRRKRDLEKYKDDLHKQKVSREKLGEVWRRYKEYYTTIIENKLNGKKNGEFSSIDETERNLINLLEEDAPFIPKNIFNELQRMLDNTNSPKNISKEDHEKIISLFREFLT